MSPEWTCTLKPDQGGKQDASLCGSQAKQGVLLRPQASNKSQSSKQAKLNTATSINAKRQRAFRASFHPNQPSHVLTFARKLTDTRIAARIAFAFKRMRPSPESIELVCKFIVPATHSERRIGCFQTSLTKNARTL